MTDQIDNERWRVPRPPNPTKYVQPPRPPGHTPSTTWRDADGANASASANAPLRRDLAGNRRRRGSTASLDSIAPAACIAIWFVSAVVLAALGRSGVSYYFALGAATFFSGILMLVTTIKAAKR
jgi:hypothetical protein